MAKEPWSDYCCPACYARVLKARAWEKELKSREVPYTTEPPLPPPKPAPPPKLEPPTNGCVFAKSCTLPNGVIDHKNPNGFVPVETLEEYGAYAVLGAVGAITTEGTALDWIGGSGTAVSLARRLGGSLALSTTGSGVGVAAPFLVGGVALLMPNTTSADSAFYKSEQYAQLTKGNTQVRINLKYLDDGAVSVYGFYTGNQPDWRQVPVVAATPRGEQLVVDVGNGFEIIWTPAVDTNEVLGIPALEAASLKPGAWVFPATEQADRILENPEHPPEYQDFIIWFPSQPQTAPIYLSLSVRYAPGVVSGAGEDVAGIWLDHASSGMGAPIPTAVVDVLRGRTYNSFDSFRRAFWREVSRVPELADQLTVINLKNSQKGRSPLVSDIEVSGKRIRFELHHIVRIVDGGGVYDVDNLRLNTPKNHIKLHDGG